MVYLGHTREMIRLISEVTIDQLQPVAEKYLRPLFASKAYTAVVCPSDKVSQVAQEFSK